MYSFFFSFQIPTLIKYQISLNSNKNFSRLNVVGKIVLYYLPATVPIYLQVLARTAEYKKKKERGREKSEV